MATKSPRPPAAVAERTESPAEDACAVAAAVLSNHAKDVPFALLYLIDPEGNEVRLAGAAGVAPGEAVSPLQMPIGASVAPWPVADVLQRQEIVVIDNLADRFNVVPMVDLDEDTRHIVEPRD